MTTIFLLLFLFCYFLLLGDFPPQNRTIRSRFYIFIAYWLLNEKLCPRTSVQCSLSSVYCSILINSKKEKPFCFIGIVFGTIKLIIGSFKGTNKILSNTLFHLPLQPSPISIEEETENGFLINPCCGQGILDVSCICFSLWGFNIYVNFSHRNIQVRTSMHSFKFIALY